MNALLSSESHMVHVKSTLKASNLFQELALRAKSQAQTKKQVLNLLPPALKNEVNAVYQKNETYYIEVQSSYAIIAIKHALKNLGAPYRIYVKPKV